MKRAFCCLMREHYYLFLHSHSSHHLIHQESIELSTNPHQQPVRSQMAIQNTFYRNIKFN